MPTLVEYPFVLDRMRSMRLKCQYFNSGAFGFERGIPIHYAGWLGPPDATVRPEALGHARHVPSPFASTLARLATRAWLELFPGPIWLMPKSHWGHELDYGGKSWLPAALQQAGFDPAPLASRADSPAVEFQPDEAGQFTALAESLLQNLFGSDFALAFPHHPIACTLHHHKHIWWVTDNPETIAAINCLLPPV